MTKIHSSLIQRIIVWLSKSFGLRFSSIISFSGSESVNLFGHLLLSFKWVSILIMYTFSLTEILFPVVHWVSFRISESFQSSLRIVPLSFTESVSESVNLFSHHKDLFLCRSLSQCQNQRIFSVMTEICSFVVHWVSVRISESFQSSLRIVPLSFTELISKSMNPFSHQWDPLPCHSLSQCVNQWIFSSHVQCFSWVILNSDARNQNESFKWFELKCHWKYTKM